MKKKINILFLTLLGIVTTVSIPVVKADTYSKYVTDEYGDVNRTAIHAYYTHGDGAFVSDIGVVIKGENAAGEEYSDYASGITWTHMMGIADDANGTNRRPVYCAWYENKTPEQTGWNTFVSLTDDEFPQADAVGLLTILDDGNEDDEYKRTSVCNNYNNRGVKEAGCIQALKTTAINLYLSKIESNAGKSCTNGDSNRFNDTFWLHAGNAVGYYTIGKGLTIDEMYSMYKGELKKLVQSDADHDSELYGRTYEYYKNEYWTAVYNLVKDAIDEKESYVSPTLEVSNPDVTYELKNGYYTKTYTFTSNYALYSIDATVKGDQDTELANVITTPDVENKKLKVQIPEASFETLKEGEKVHIDVDAKVKVKKALIFTTAASFSTKKDFRCTYQDLVFGEVGYDYLTARDDDTIQMTTCYNYDTSCTNTTCTNKKNNKTTCSSDVSEYDCFVKDEGTNEYGKLMYEVSGGAAGVCKLYCKEKASISYPGNVLGVTLGSHFTWPTANGVGAYPLITESKLECHVEGPVTACAPRIYELDYINGNTAGKLIYNNLEKDVEKKLVGDCKGEKPVFTNSITVEIKNKCTYSISKSEATSYNAFSIKTLEAVKTDISKYTNRESKDSNTIFTSHGMMPIIDIEYEDFDELKKIIGDEYALKIQDISLGFRGDFNSDLDPYACYYTVTEKTDACYCPTGTKMAGKNLYSYIVNSDTMTCADAQHTYCSDGGDDICTDYHELCTCKDQSTGESIDLENCLMVENKDYTTCVAEEPRCTLIPPPPTNPEDPEGLSCPPGTPREYEDISACKLTINPDTGKHYTDDECIQNNCYGYCPKESDYSGKDISACITERRQESTYKSYTAAYNVCRLTECYKCKGVNCYDVIYRTISLENPFVGKQNNVSGLEVSVAAYRINHAFNYDASINSELMIYRDPGSNWNSAATIYDKIWYNRGYKASAIYQEATPLYTINLDATAIKAIRDYNDKQIANDAGYADFTLKCTEGAYCISSFLRSNIKNAKGKNILDYSNSTCADATSKNAFNACLYE